MDPEVIFITWTTLKIHDWLIEEMRIKSTNVSVSSADSKAQLTSWLMQPSVCPIRPPHAAAAGLLLWTRRPGDIDRLLHGRRAGGQQQPRRSSKCGQCHVVSWRRKLNTDSYENEISFLFSVDCVRTCCVRTDTAADDLWKTLVALCAILLTVGLRSLFDADVYTPRRYSVTSYFLHIACNAWVVITVHALFTIWALKCCRIKMFSLICWTTCTPLFDCC